LIAVAFWAFLVFRGPDRGGFDLSKLRGVIKVNLLLFGKKCWITGVNITDVI
jgi:hypothetical protein